jgi:hypothetical protein
MDRLIERKDIEKGSTPYVRGSFGKPDLNRVDREGNAFMVKDVRGKNFFLRWTLGLWLIRKEWKVYSRLAGIKGVPRPLERIDRFAFAVEFIAGRPISRGEPLPSSFFPDLENILAQVHARGVVHMDLRHKGNILLSESGAPFLIDFNSSFAFREKGILRRYLFPLLQWVDYGGLLKLKRRVSPSVLTPDETAFLRKFDRIRKLWIFN